MSYRNFIFDWSGTLVNDFPPTLDATNVVLGRYGVAEMSEEVFRARFRLPYTEFYEEVLPGVAMAELEEHFRVAFRASRHGVGLLSGAREMLEWLRGRGGRLFVLSSMDEGVFLEQARDLQVREFFEDIHAGVIDKRERIGRILEENGLLAAETCFVGDMVHDVETARFGGVASVAVLTGYDSRERLSSVRPDLMMTDLAAFRSWLEVAGKEVR
ncbi:MAG: HAD family hydrolase [Verrucomicrobiales bacterium]